MDFAEYRDDNIQMCISLNTKKILRRLKFIHEPYAWLVGQTLNYFLRKNNKMDNILKQKINQLEIDFDFPIVG